MALLKFKYDCRFTGAKSKKEYFAIAGVSLEVKEGDYTHLGKKDYEEVIEKKPEDTGAPETGKKNS